MFASLWDVFEASAFFVYVASFATLMLGSLAGISFLFSSPFIGWARSTALARSAFGFVALLHAFALPANAVFVATGRGRLYYAADPIADFLPYMPFSSWTTDPACGGYLLAGFGELSFFAVWLAFAIPVWAATIFVFRRMSGTPT